VFGVFQSGPRRPIDSFVEADERVIWVDRFNPSRPRRERVKTWPYLRENAFNTFSLVVGAIVAVALAIDPTFARQILPEWKHLQLLIVLFAALLCPLAIHTVIEDWTIMTRGERMPFDFLLTDKRLLALSQHAREADAVSLSRITSCHLDGSDLILIIPDLDGERRLWDLADPAAALRAFEQSLPAFAPHDGTPV
jgi:hypothetical protein